MIGNFLVRLIVMNKFDNAYKSVNSESYSPNCSLIEFFDFASTRYLQSSHTDILEVGCGRGLTLSDSNLDLILSGIEISSEACSAVNDQRIICADFLEHPFDSCFDLILDSHAAHCLSSVDKLKAYFKKSFETLNQDGLLIIEMMCQHSNFTADSGFSYDKNDYTLKRENIVHRIILPSREIEEIVQASGLKIVYLRVDETLKFIPYSHRSEALPSDPDRLRMICLKD